jgi:hypothetical protein
LADTGYGAGPDLKMASFPRSEHVSHFESA